MTASIYKRVDAPENYTPASVAVALDANDDQVRLHTGSGNGHVFVSLSPATAREVAAGLVEAADALYARQETA